MPALLYDGDCAFCRMWVDFWRSLTGDAVDYVPYQAAADRFPDVPAAECQRAVQFVTEDRRYSAAEAVSELARYAAGYEWLPRAYGKVPGFQFLAEFLYRFIASHRNAGYRVTRALWGARVERPTYRAASGLFASVFAFIYLIAFASFGMQVRGLIGSNGILPAAMFLRMAASDAGGPARWKLPTIFWWTQSDFALLSICWGGVALAAVAILARPHSKWQRGIFALLFVYYLSIVSAGQVFMSYQWDLLLLEAGFLAIFLRPSLPRVWLFHWLLFRLMFESGLVKLLSHDPTWHNLTALTVHYETQPLPTALAWYMAQAPQWFHKASALSVFAIELILPFFIFGPPRLKRIAAYGTIALQALIFATGNYTFFNLLTMALCIFLFDDSFFARKRKYTAQPAAVSNRFVSAVLFLFVMTVSTIELAAHFSQVPVELDRIVELQMPFGLVNSYGLFASMTTTRNEIEIEGSIDGTNWQPYVFRYKPGPLDRAPRMVAPFQPRLDWQMWFAALGSFRQSPWMVRLMLQLLEGSKPVLALLERDPFGGTPPKQVRSMLYEYHFTNFDEKRKTGNWWKREAKGMYFPPVGIRH